MNQTKNPKRLEIHISYSCNNNCIFCSEAKQLDKFRGQFIEFDEIQKIIDDFSKKGVSHVTFTGGEPTLHPRLLDILKYTRNKDITTYITTNGDRLSSYSFAEKILPLIDQICFSIHGDNEELHNKQTQNNNSFSKLVTALNNTNQIKKEGGFANIVINNKNIDSIEKIIDFISQYEFINQILISSIAPEGRGEENFQELVVRISEMEERVRNIIKAIKKNGLKVRFFGLPLCALKSNMALSNDLHWDPRITIEKWSDGKKEFLKKTVSYKPDRKRTKVDKCQKCKAKGLCPGVFEKYLQLFGDQEIKIIK